MAGWRPIFRALPWGMHLRTSRFRSSLIHKEKSSLPRERLAIRKGLCHFRTGRRRPEVHVVSQLLPISTRKRRWVALPKRRRQRVAIFQTRHMSRRCRSRASQSRANKRTRKVRFHSIRNDRYPPTHPSFGAHALGMHWMWMVRWCIRPTRLTLVSIDVGDSEQKKKSL